MDIQNSKVRPGVEGFPKGEGPAGGASQPSASGSGPFLLRRQEVARSLSASSACPGDPPPVSQVGAA